MTSRIDLLWRLRRTLLDDSRSDVLAECLDCARRLLLEASSDEILDAVAPSVAAELRTMVAGLDHIGFVAPDEGREQVSRVAMDRGFDSCQWAFWSQLIAAELAAISGSGAPVKTAVLKATGYVETRPVVVEIFCPSEVPAPVVRDWVRAGVGPHVAMPLRRGQDLARATELLRSIGFTPPEIMRDGPRTNAAERVTAIYLDGVASGEPVRLELCHYELVGGSGR